MKLSIVLDAGTSKLLKDRTARAIGHDGMPSWEIEERLWLPALTELFVRGGCRAASACSYESTYQLDHNRGHPFPVAPYQPYRDWVFAALPYRTAAVDEAIAPERSRW